MADERPVFPLKLEQSYYEKGFFNVPVHYDDFVRKDDGPVLLLLRDGRQIEGYVNRSSANNNRTTRVMGRFALRDWFKENYSQGDTIPITFESPQRLRLGY